MISRWRRKSDDLPLPFDIEQQLEECFERMHKLLEDAGHRPFGEIELKLPLQSFEYEVIYRWRREA